MMLVMGVGAFAMASLPVLSALGSFLWHIMVLCAMSAALLVVWYAYQVNICPCSYLSINTMSALLATADTAALGSCLNSMIASGILPSSANQCAFGYLRSSLSRNLNH